MQVDIFMAGGGGWGAWVKKGDVALQKSSKILRNIFAVDMAKKLLSCYAWQITISHPALQYSAFSSIQAKTKNIQGMYFGRGHRL